MSVEKMNPAKAAKWLHDRTWAGGLALQPNQSVDALEFYFQYLKNKKSWDKAFAWLKETDLNAVAPGKYNIDDNHVYASVAEGNPKDPDDVKWEAHKRYIDIQYVISGKEKMGVAPLTNAVAIDKFNTGKDIGFYNIPEADCHYYTADASSFFIFFPQNAHRPGIMVKGSGFVKKVVIKVMC